MCTALGQTTHSPLAQPPKKKSSYQDHNNEDVCLLLSMRYPTLGLDKVYEISQRVKDGYDKSETKRVMSPDGNKITNSSLVTEVASRQIQALSSHYQHNWTDEEHTYMREAIDENKTPKEIWEELKKTVPQLTLKSVQDKVHEIKQTEGLFAYHQDNLISEGALKKIWKKLKKTNPDLTIETVKTKIFSVEKTENSSVYYHSSVYYCHHWTNEEHAYVAQAIDEHKTVEEIWEELRKTDPQLTLEAIKAEIKTKQYKIKQKKQLSLSYKHPWNIDEVAYISQAIDEKKTCEQIWLKLQESDSQLTIDPVKNLIRLIKLAKGLSSYQHRWSNRECLDLRQAMEEQKKPKEIWEELKKTDPQLTLLAVQKKTKYLKNKFNITHKAS